MSDYIKREDALNMDFRISARPFESRLKTAERAVQAYANEISKIPAADVVEVVRCEDCVFWECPNAPTHNRHMCSYWEVGTYGYDFCSYGERRSE